MNILKTNDNNLDVLTKYKLLRTGWRMGDVIDDNIDVKSYILKEDDEKVTLSILDFTEQTYYTGSETFIKSFMEIVDLLESDGIVKGFTIGVRSKMSKNNRSFLYCTLEGVDG